MRRIVTHLHPYKPRYLKLLGEALGQPEKNIMPTCNEHIEALALAQSIHRQELKDGVIVLVEPGIRDARHI